VAWRGSLFQLVKALSSLGLRALPQVGPQLWGTFPRPLAGETAHVGNQSMPPAAAIGLGAHLWAEQWVLELNWLQLIHEGSLMMRGSSP